MYQFVRFACFFALTCAVRLFYIVQNVDTLPFFRRIINRQLFQVLCTTKIKIKALKSFTNGVIYQWGETALLFSTSTTHTQLRKRKNVSGFRVGLHYGASFGVTRVSSINYGNDLGFRYYPQYSKFSYQFFKIKNEF